MNSIREKLDRIFEEDSEKSDRIRYDELVRLLRSSKNLNGTQELQKELEKIKNRNKGNTPETKSSD